MVRAVWDLIEGFAMTTRTFAALAMVAMLGAATVVEAAPGGRRGRGMGGGWLRRADPSATQPGGQQQGQKGTLTMTVDKDSLSEKEAEGLKTQKEAAEKAAEAAKGESKLTKEELEDLEESIDSISFYIWSH